MAAACQTATIQAPKTSKYVAADDSLQGILYLFSILKKKDQKFGPEHFFLEMTSLTSFISVKNALCRPFAFQEDLEREAKQIVRLRLASETGRPSAVPRWNFIMEGGEHSRSE